VIPSYRQLFLDAIDLHKRGRLGEASACYKRLLELVPSDCQSLHMLGVVSIQLGHFTDAIEFISKSICIDGSAYQFHVNLGIAYLRSGSAADSLQHFDHALVLAPNISTSYVNRGAAYQRLNRFDEALADFERAISLDPNSADAFLNKGHALKELCRLSEAAEAFEHSTRLRPSFAEAHCELAYISLLTGDFLHGFRLYEWRWFTDDLHPFSRRFPQPRWYGDSSLDGLTILIHAEQGFGDSIQFCRYVRLVKRLGAKVLLEVPSPLYGLFNGLEGVDCLLVRGDPLPFFDVHCPLLSLPLAFSTLPSSIPLEVPYIKSSATLRGEWASRLGRRSRLRVGLAWSGNRLYKGDHNRSVSLSSLLPYLPLGVDYFCLQREIQPCDQLALAQSTISFYGDDLTFASTAALIDQLDLVVCTDTSIAHLAGAMGKPCWVMLPFIPDWRWMLNGATTAWYPSVSLVRQNSDRDWTVVFSRVSEQLNLVGLYP